MRPTRPPDILRRTGLPVDPMFSAPKLAWLLDADDPDAGVPRPAS